MTLEIIRDGERRGRRGRRAAPSRPQVVETRPPRARWRPRGSRWLRERGRAELGEPRGPRARSGARRAGRRRHLRDRRARRGVHGGVPRRARARGRLLLRGPRAGRAGRRRPSWVLVVDPIDGTRPAMAGLRVGLRLGRGGAARPASRRWATSRSACVVEIKSGARSSPRAGGASTRRRGCRRTRTSADVLDLRPARPARAAAEVLGELIDGSSVGGGTFDLGSATYDMTRVDRPARRLRRAGPADGRRGARMRGGVRAGRRRRGAQQLALRPRRRADLEEAGRGRHRRLRAPLADDRPLLGSGTSSRCRASRGEPRAARRSSGSSTPGSSGSRLGPPGPQAPGSLPPHASGSRPRPSARSPTTRTSSGAG